MSTLHSNNVFEAIHRLDNLGVKGDDIATSLKLVVSQRLVPGLCGCGGTSGCQNCGGKGVAGRLPVMEMLEINSECKRLISHETAISIIEQQAFSQGFIPMREVGLELVESGKISRTELDAVCPAATYSGKARV